MNIQNALKISTALFCLLIASLARAGDVGPMPGYCPYQGGCYMLTGVISKDDLATLGTALTRAQSNNQGVAVRLNSPGGDFQTAIALGRLMRSAGAHAVGGNADVCMSSCVMLLAGATFRGHAGRVGIHRPYRMSTAPTSVLGMKKEFDSWSSEARTFLTDVNVSTRLWDEMIRIPPEQVRVLSEAELISFGLKGEVRFRRETTATTPDIWCFETDMQRNHGGKVM